ncbi:MULTISPECIES: FAD/NAD(P)-binding domain-containing protein [Streptomyces]|uniref:FAD/NAD(P)-binding protein n=1 Tax=Streptomyces TaxID=1883 RepID=UPI0015708105|nr:MULTISPECIES: FAD/NAD(P)-binding protein [Streptomyces]NSC25052.1 FAD/NAD(P)-binding protein [Streptomyces albus subsp. chlorinus]
MNTTAHEIAVIGAGPRGLAVLERLCANERARPFRSRVLVHLVDSAPAGAGSVWRTGQSRHLLANTVASQITVFTDVASRIAGPIEPGPSLYEWAASLPAPPAGDDAAGSTPDTAYDAATLAEAHALGPDSYPTRALCGRYFADCLRRVVEGAPAHVEIRVHRSRAVAMADTLGYSGGPQGVRLENGTRLNHLDAVVLAQGHLPTRPTPHEERIASLARINHLTYLPPANPADARLDGIRAGEPVLLRGLGLCFFDYLALFTLGRGGLFDRVGGELVYRPSGEEPLLYASSRRGVPFHARGENEKGAHGRHLPRLLTADHVARLRTRAARAGAGLSFAQDLWPLIAREVETVYYETWLRHRRGAEAAELFAARYAACAEPAAREALVDAHRIPAADRWDWAALADPARTRTFTDRDDFRAWLLDRLAEDVRQAREGNVGGPVKAALDVLRDLRNEIRLAVDHGGLEGSSHRDELDRWYTPLNAFLSIGPPPRRVEEMRALVRAGVLELTGPGTRIRIDTRRRAFVADSETVPGPTVRAGVLIEARLPAPDLRRTADPLLRHLRHTDACAPYRVATADGGTYETGGLAVTPRPYRLLDARGRAHPRRFAYGVPTEAVHWVTAAGIRPGVDSVTLADADAIARTVLGLGPSDAAAGATAAGVPHGEVLL